MKDLTKVKVVIAVIVAIFAIVATVLLTRSSIERSLKSVYSDYSGGLDRTVNVYDYSGNLIESYSGKIDVEDSQVAGKVKFDLDGKRTIIYGGIVIVQEN